MDKGIKLDQNEQRIFEAFSRIKVDITSLQGVNMNRRSVKKPLRLIITAASVMILIVVSGTAYASGGGLEMFLSRFNPDFGAFAIAPLEPAYAVDQGIRIEVVGAQQIGGVVLLYVSMQDISGDGRITSYHLPDFELIIDGQMRSGGRSKRLSFDKSTNTSYFEIMINGELGMTRADSLELVVSGIMDLEHSGQMQWLAHGHWQMMVNTSDIGIEPIVWTDIQAGDIYIEYMSLTPFGLQAAGGGWASDWPMLDAVQIEMSSRWRNVRPNGAGGGFSPDGEFEAFWNVASPIDLEAVEAVVFRGVRIPVDGRQ